jgi:hypothetical protein
MITCKIWIAFSLIHPVYSIYTRYEKNMSTTEARQVNAAKSNVLQMGMILRRNYILEPIKT